MPIPLLINGEFLIINYDFKYLMVDVQYEQRDPMTELEVHECRGIREKNVLLEKRLSRHAHGVDCGFGL